MPVNSLYIPTDPASSEAFEKSARGTLQSLRSALAEVIAGIEGFSLNEQASFADFARHLEIDKKLAWKMGKVVLSRDPFEAAQNMPGQGGLSIFLDAAARRGAEPAAVERAREAFEAYRGLIRVHAGNKAEFESMLARFADAGTARTDLDHRRAAFQANTYLFGVQARVQLRADFLHPAESGDPDRVDSASGRGFIDFVRTRADVEWPLGRPVYGADNRPPSMPVLTPIDPPPPTAPPSPGAGETPVQDQVPLLRDFCSRPLGQRRAAEGRGGAPELLLEAGPIGRTAAITWLTGEVARDHGDRWASESCTHTGMAVRCYTPCERLVCDQYVHASLFGRVEPSLSIVPELYQRAAGHDTLGRMQVPTHERVAFLGAGLDAAATPLLPRQRELASHVFSRLGWNPDDFLVYRLVIEYPVIPTVAFMWHPLPERPRGV